MLKNRSQSGVIGTIGSAMPHNLCLPALEQGYNCDQGRIQSVALGHRTPFLGFLQGKDGNMCPAVRHS